MRFRLTLRADYDRFCEMAKQPAGRGLWRAFMHPRVAPVAWMRVAMKLRALGLGPVGALIGLAVQMVFRVEAPARADIGPGFVLPHPGGITIGSARIGRNVTIFQNVTLGARFFESDYDLATRPVIEDGVIIGAGAVVLGPVTVGTGAVVAANSLLVQDAPPGSTAIGVPARIKQAEPS